MEDSFGGDELDESYYEKYSTELYGILCSITLDEAKGILKGMVDSAGEQDGF